MRILIAGLGSIGRRHLANVRRLVPDAGVAIWRHERDSGSPPGTRAVYSLEEALAFEPEAALVTGPASTHIQTALPLARAGVHLMIEKPLSDTLDGVDELLQICAEKGVCLMVAYNFRFCEPLQRLRQCLREGRIGRVMNLSSEVGQYLPDWRPGADYRQSVSAQKRLGGGVILELSHELDMARWMMGEARSVSAVSARLGDLDVDVEDSADILLTFDRALAAIHLDMVRRAPCRRCVVLGTEGQIEWDGLTNEVRWFSAASRSWEILVPPGAWDRSLMYEAEVAHFLDCARTGKTPAVDGEEGRRTLALALAVKRSAQERREVVL